jgi:demethylmenaquinone methyltransferase/2-methoxy-6-polyprenyl-1,4-benzoquinol methylase
MAPHLGLRLTQVVNREPKPGVEGAGLPLTPEHGVSVHWVNCDRDFICRRYDRIAVFISLFEWALLVPSKLRKRAVDHLGLRLGDRVLEVGCGTGRNFAFLRAAVGPAGRIYGVDLSAGMLREARKLCQGRNWHNVSLTQCDAADYAAPELVDGVLFSLCYNTMPHHLTVLRQAWTQLRPGGRLVIMDAKPPPGLLGKVVLPFAVWLMKRTLLGNPLIRPWEHHAALVENFRMEEFRLGSYYVCWGTKPTAWRYQGSMRTCTGSSKSRPSATVSTSRDI